MRLRTRLFLLVAGTVVPLVSLALFLGVLLVDHERQIFRQGAIDRNRAVMSAVDAEIHGHVTTLQALSAFRSIAAGDLPAIHDAAKRVLATQRNWQQLMLSAPDGTTLVDGTHEFGAALPPDPDLPSLLKAVDQKTAAVGNVVLSPRAGTYGIPIRLPIVRGGVVTFVLTAIVHPAQFQFLIEAQKLPPEWVSGLVDRDGHFIARVPGRSNAESASPEFLAQTGSGFEGWYRGLTVEGLDTFTAFRRSTETGWSIGLAIPSRIVFASATRALWVLVLGTIVALAVALGFAWWMSRRIAAPIASLATAARAVGRRYAHPRLASESTIIEVRDVATALDEAAAAVLERETLLEREQEALKAADRAKDEFLAMLGHELRNPMSAIGTAAHILGAVQPGSPMDRQARAIIERQSRQMSRLIEDLLDISRLTMGKVRLRTEPFDLAQLAQHVVQTWRQSARVAPDRIALDVEPAWIDGDRARMEQVLANLIDNANKFTPPGKRIFVTVRSRGGEAVLDVADEGDGIAPEMLDQVFELFMQAPQGPDRSDGGLGLGLALVRRLVQMHGGTVRAKSAGVGHGTTFTVSLPAIEPAGAVHRAEGAPAGVSRPLRILLVEDNADARDMVQAVLALAGHDVRPFSNGEAALAEARRFRPDVAIVDIGLPGMDGHEVARRLRADPELRRLRLIALTGYGLPEDERRAQEAGFDRHLTKPVEPQALASVLAGLAPSEAGSPQAMKQV
ncbi:MAG TPA: ATP-binding protein [Usitatibacter sp.]|nr:ATP-binding protein [Usitatibacter sp.]